MAEKRGTREEVAARWRERLSRWQQQQCSVTEFCRRERINQPSFYLWRKRLAAEEARKSRASHSSVARAAAFIPVEAVSDHRAGMDHTEPRAWLEISRGQLVCRVCSQVDEQTLRSLVRVLCEEAV
jgi:hypothetical protein